LLEDVDCGQDRTRVFSTDIVYTMDIHHQLDRLRILKGLTHEDSARIYLALASEIKTYDQINLVIPPPTQVPLFIVAPLGTAGWTRWSYMPCYGPIPPIQKSSLRNRRPSRKNRRPSCKPNPTQTRHFFPLLPLSALPSNNLTRALYRLARFSFQH
jgi:hypothetical protein